jgi:hypothetical protein
MANKTTIISDFDSLTTYTLPGGTYNQDHLGLGTLMRRMTGSKPQDKWVGPIPVSHVHTLNGHGGTYTGVLSAIRWSNDIDWVFGGDVASASGTRRVAMYTYDRRTGEFSTVGFIITTPPGGGNCMARDIAATYDLHTAGTVAVSGTTVTGTSTTWSTDGVCVGNRIGFGSTDPTQITAWYEITAVGSNTSITVATTPGTISAGTAYVIEDLRIVNLITCSITANGGLLVTKGLSYQTFANQTTVAAATTTDNIRATYWLADNASNTNTAGCGLILEPVTNKTTHTCWAMDSTGGAQMFKYNLRAALSGLASGKSTSAFVLKTNSQAVTGTLLAYGNGVYAVPNHGTNPGSPAGVFVTSTRVYCSKPLSTITASDTTWDDADFLDEVPPGGTATFQTLLSNQTVEYLGLIDRFLVSVGNSQRLYLARFGQAEFDRVMHSNYRRGNFLSGGAFPDNDSPAVFSTYPYSPYLGINLAGITYMVDSAGQSGIFAYPLEADWEYASTSNQRVIFPKISTSNVNKYGRVDVSYIAVIGGRNKQNLGEKPGPHRILYRTSGISDNSGGWTVLSDTGDLSAVTPAASIQFAVEFRTMGETGLLGRVYSLAFSYDDISTDVHFSLSTKLSSIANEQFAWSHDVPFGKSVPALRVRLYNAESGSLLVDDNTAAPTGTWERSINGGSSWSAWTNTDKSNGQTYVRYTPASLTNDIPVRAILTLN